MSGDWRNARRTHAWATPPTGQEAAHEAPVAIGNFVGLNGANGDWAVAPGYQPEALAELEWARAQMIGTPPSEGGGVCIWRRTDGEGETDDVGGGGGGVAEVGVWFGESAEEGECACNDEESEQAIAPESLSSAQDDHWMFRFGPNTASIEGWSS